MSWPGGASGPWDQLARDARWWERERGGRTWVVSLKLTESAFTAEADGIQNPSEGSVCIRHAVNEIDWCAEPWPVSAFNLNKNKQKNFPESLGGVAVCAETRLIEAASHGRCKRAQAGTENRTKPGDGKGLARSRVRNKVFLNTLNCGVQDLTLEGRARPGAWAVD